MAQGPTQRRDSLAARFRGWTDDATALEQQLKDVETFARSYQRRWYLIVGGALVVMLAWTVGLAEAPPLLLVVAFAAFALANKAIGMLHVRGTYRWWAIYLLATFDLVIVGFTTFVVGHGGVVALYFLTTLPYVFDQGRAFSDFVVLVGSLTYLAACTIHEITFPGQTSGAMLFGIPAVIYLETIIFIAVAMGLKTLPAALLERIRRTRGVIAESEHGHLGVRAAATEHDELGFLERSFNRMLEQIAGTIAGVQHEADEVAAFAEELAASAQQLQASSDEVHSTARVASDAL